MYVTDVCVQRPIATATTVRVRAMSVNAKHSTSEHGAHGIFTQQDRENDQTPGYYLHYRNRKITKL